MGQLMFKNILTVETTDYDGIKDFTPYTEDFTPYKEEAPYDIHAASNVCIDILKAVMKLRYATFYNTVTKIILKHGFRHRDPEQHGKWTYNFTYSFKRYFNWHDVMYNITIIFNDDGTISEVILENSNFQALDKDVKDTIYVNFVMRYNYCRAQEESKNFSLKSLHKNFMVEDKFMNRDEFQGKVRAAIYGAVKKYIIEDIFDLYPTSYVNLEDYYDAVRTRFKCEKIDCDWYKAPYRSNNDYGFVGYTGVFSVLFNGHEERMEFMVRCVIDQRDTTDIFKSLSVCLGKPGTLGIREYHSEMLEKEIRKAVEAVVPHTYVEPKTAWPTVNPNITQLWAYDLIAKISKDYKEEKKMTLEKANDIYSKFDSEQREAVRVLRNDGEKKLLKELGDLKVVLEIGRQDCKNLIKDRENMKYLLNSAYGVATAQHNKFEIKEIIINEPAMIIFWKDGTKTVVTAQEGDTFDEEKGLAMAYAKKALGNNYAAGGRFKQRLKHAKRISKTAEETDISKIPICKEIMQEAMRRVKAEMEADAAKKPTEKPAAKKPTTRKAKK